MLTQLIGRIFRIFVKISLEIGWFRVDFLNSVFFANVLIEFEYFIIVLCYQLLELFDHLLCEHLCPILALLRAVGHL